MSLLDWIKIPLKTAGKVGRGIEAVGANYFVPEQILSKSEAGKRLWDFTVKESAMSRKWTEFYKQELGSIVKTYGLNDEEKIGKFLKLLEFYPNNKRFPTLSEMTEFSPETIRAVSDHLTKITDPIWAAAAANAPKTPGYMPGYFTHFPVKSIKKRAEDELVRLADLKAGTDPSQLEMIQKYDKDIARWTTSLEKATELEARIKGASLKAQHYKQQPAGGYFGPLDEARKLAKDVGYRMDYKDVMEDYIDGAMRKIFLDRYMKPATKLMESEKNQALKEYMFDYITAQRGALSGSRKVFWNEAWSQLFPDTESGYRGVARAVDYATRFQYLSKIGLSWFRFPFVNSMQPLMTLYPMTGGKTLIKAYGEAFTNPTIWKEAKDAGVIFEATLRKGVTEFLGRHNKLTTVEKKLSWPAQFSEELNRVVSYAAGKMQAEKMGLMGQDAVNHAIGLVNRTQFIYHKEALPLVMSKSPAGRLIFQFRTFTANYVNFLTQLIRTKNHKALARAIGSLGVIAGSAAVPFNIWEETRKLLLRNTGKDIGEFNPIESLSELAGISPPINFGKSIEPFNIPRDASDLFGPTIGPILKMAMEAYKKPEEANETFQRWIESQVPPVMALGRGLLQPEVRTEESQTYPMGRLVGRRSLTETMFLRPSLEATRQKYIELIANAYAGGRKDVAARLIIKGRELGLRLDLKDVAIAKGRGTKLKGVKPPTVGGSLQPAEIPTGQQTNLAPTPITMKKMGE